MTNKINILIFIFISFGISASLLSEKSLAGCGGGCRANEVCEWTCPSGNKIECFDHIDLHGIPFRVCAYVGGTAGLCELQCKEYGNYDSEDDN